MNQQDATFIKELSKQYTKRKGLINQALEKVTPVEGGYALIVDEATLKALKEIAA